MQNNKHSKKNYILGILNGTLFNFAFAITGSKTVLPLFISTLTSNGVFIGLAGSLEDVLWPLPQIFTAHYLEGKPYKKFMYIYTAYIRTIMMFAMGILIFFLPSYTLPLFFVFLTIYLLSGGFAGLSFMEIIGKTISPDKLPSFWGYRLGLGGILAVFGGFFVKYSIAHFSYPINYAILFITAGFVVAIALFSFSIAYEPPSIGQEKTDKFSHFIKDGSKTLNKDKRFKALLFYRIFIGISMGAIPFYSIYAIKILNYNSSIIGIFISIQMTGMILSNILWNKIAKKYSMIAIMNITAIIVSLQPILALMSLKAGIIPMYLLFFLVGASFAGLRIGHTSYLLFIAPERKRPTYVGFMNTLTAPIMFYPMLNGYLIDRFSYNHIFVISAIIGIVSFFIIRNTK